MIIRILLIIAGICVLGLYILPLVTLGTLNAGNLFGYGVSAVLLISGIFYGRVEAFIRSLLESDKGITLLLASVIVLALFCLLFFITLFKIIAHSKYTAKAQSTVVVLGCRIRGSVPSVTLKARCAAATEYLKGHPDSIVIATGGQGADEDLSEGQCIFNLLTESGISPDRVFIENKSANTDENILNAKKIIVKNGFSYEVAVATSEYHQYRASMICKKNGLNAASIPCASAAGWKATYFTREVFGVWAQHLKK